MSTQTQTKWRIEHKVRHQWLEGVTYRNKEYASDEFETLDKAEGDTRLVKVTEEVVEVS